jgi:fumarate reductase subunit D
MAKSNDPLPWSLFAVGGVVAAFLMPITVLFTGFARLLGWVSAPGFYTLLHHPLARLYLFVVIALPLFHGMHRILLTLMDFGLKRARLLLAALFYGVALGGTLAAMVFLVRL